jgi:hypothetical protein
MTSEMMREAKKSPEKWRGCVEVGMGIMRTLFTNHVRFVFRPHRIS